MMKHFSKFKSLCAVAAVGLLTTACADKHEFEPAKQEIAKVQGFSSYIMKPLTDIETCVSYFAMNAKEGYTLTVRLDRDGKPLLDKRCLETETETQTRQKEY